jgi:hypothetical protein
VRSALSNDRSASKRDIARSSVGLGLSIKEQDQALKDICGYVETLTTARILLREVQQKAGPGSGFEDDIAPNALPAMCAYLASERCVYFA